MRALLVPIKAFADAKARLAPVLDADDREALARRLAEGVLRAVSSMQVAVVCDDEDVAAFGEAHGARVIWTLGLGLSGAVSKGVVTLAAEGISTVVVAHADLSRPAGLRKITAAAADSSVTLVPDRRRDGTNVIVVPSAAGFGFSYGPGSFSRHLEEAARLGLEAVVVEDGDLAIDVDVPSDLSDLGSTA